MKTSTLLRGLNEPMPESSPTVSVGAGALRNSPGPSASSAVYRAFTLTELLAVVAATVLVALLSATALAHSQKSADRAICANNLCQLTQAWQMYADDYSSALMGNSAGISGSYLNWVKGVLDFNPNNLDNVSTANLINSANAAMGFYVKSPGLFRCPADLSTVIRSGVPALRVRSYSMNSYVGLGATAWSPGYQVMTNLSQVGQPERTFVLLEEHPNSINDGSFTIDVARVGPAAVLVDAPAYFHMGGANLAMADGHVEYWQWADPRTMPPLTSPFFGDVASPNNPDIARLQKVTSYRP
jgi:prepilin-type processing-associated H-X9-DG protein